MWGRISLKKTLRERGQGRISGFVFVAPWLIGFLVFTLGPCLYTLGISFTKWNMLNTPTFVSFANYINLLDDKLFLKSLEVTFRFVFVGVSTAMLLALGLALLLNANNRLMYVFRTVFYVPSVVSGIAVAILWSWIFSKNFGILNYVLSLFGLPGPNWLGDPSWAPWAFVIIMSTTFVGAPMIIFVAGLQNIPVHLYEAASIDGAGYWQKLRGITLPALSPIILFNLVTMVIGAFKTFTQAYTISGKNGDPDHSLLFVVMRIYNKAFGTMEFGSASAMSWVFLILVLLVSLLIMRLTMPMVHYEEEV